MELDVRTRYAELLAARREAAVREDGLKRLRSYLELLESRGASGQPVESDLLRGRLRVATEDAARQAALEHADRARAELDSLDGPRPDAPLELAPLPSPARLGRPGGPRTRHRTATDDRLRRPPRPASPGPSCRSPDVAAALREVDAARAGLDATLAERRPTLSLARRRRPLGDRHHAPGAPRPASERPGRRSPRPPRPGPGGLGEPEPDLVPVRLRRPPGARGPGAARPRAGRSSRWWSSRPMPAAR